MKRNLLAIGVQIIVVIAIIIYFTMIPMLVKQTYEKGLHYEEQVTIKDIHKDIKN